MTINENQNPALTEEIIPDSPIKEFLVNYAGEKFKPEDEGVTVEMVVDILAAEFPEFLMAVAEENFLRGYTTGLEDAYQAFETENKTTTAAGSACELADSLAAADEFDGTDQKQFDTFDQRV